MSLWIDFDDFEISKVMLSQLLQINAFSFITIVLTNSMMLISEISIQAKLQCNWLNFRWSHWKINFYAPFFDNWDWTSQNNYCITIWSIVKYKALKFQNNTILLLLYYLMATVNTVYSYYRWGGFSPQDRKKHIRCGKRCAANAKQNHERDV